MKNFYKIENNLPSIGCGLKILEGFAEFEVGKEPKNLKDAIAFEKSLNDKNNRIAELKQLLRDSDYVALADYDQDKPELIKQRQSWRAELRGLDD